MQGLAPNTKLTLLAGLHCQILVETEGNREDESILIIIHDIKERCIVLVGVHSC